MAFNKLHERVYALEAATTPEMHRHLDKLHALFANPTVVSAYTAAVSHLHQSQHGQPAGKRTAWATSSPDDFVLYFTVWIADARGPHDVVDFGSLYSANPAAAFFLAAMKTKTNELRGYTAEVAAWLREFVAIRERSFADCEEYDGVAVGKLLELLDSGL